jgi:hypothetical protein
VPVKIKVKISQNFVAFSEYMNFTTQDKSTLEISQNFVAFSEYINFKYVNSLLLKLEATFISCQSIVATLCLDNLMQWPKSFWLIRAMILFEVKLVQVGHKQIHFGF